MKLFASLLLLLGLNSFATAQVNSKGGKAARQVVMVPENRRLDQKIKPLGSSQKARQLSMPAPKGGKNSRRRSRRRREPRRTRTRTLRRVSGRDLRNGRRASNDVNDES